jgi:hypothetical protein
MTLRASSGIDSERITCRCFFECYCRRTGYPSVSHLLYLRCQAGAILILLQALVDYGSSINLIHESVVSALKIPVKPYIGMKVSLAMARPHCHVTRMSFCLILLQGIPRRDTFFVSSIGLNS